MRTEASVSKSEPGIIWRFAQSATEPSPPNAATPPTDFATPLVDHVVGCGIELAHTTEPNILSFEPAGAAADNYAAGKVQTAEDFLQRTFPPKIALVENLVCRRDLVALGARRRHGKTTFVMQLAVDLAVPAPSFLGYNIPKPSRSLLFLLEDDPRELQEKLTTQCAGREHAGRIALYTREDFSEQGISVDIGDKPATPFREFVKRLADQHAPDLIVFDNMAQLIGADYNDSKKAHQLAAFAYDLAKSSGAAIVVCAHPRKRSAGKNGGQEDARLDADPEGFFESIMGSSHFINSFGSLWGLERRDERTLFLGGRQRTEGQQQVVYLEHGDDKRFTLLSDVEVNLSLLLNTEARVQAWRQLPSAPFTYTEGREATKNVLKSKDAYNTWIQALKRVGALHEAPDRKLCKTRHRAP